MNNSTSFLTIDLSEFILPEIGYSNKVIHNKDYYYISGPISAYVSIVNGVKYIIFGDKHFDIKHSCTLMCNTFNDGRYKEYEENCWEIVGLLWEIFIINESNTHFIRKFIDFYFEQPIITKEDLNNPKLRELKIDNYTNDEDSHIGRIRTLYHNCFIKKECPFKNVRFHNTDVRQHFVNTDLNESVVHLISLLIENKLKSFISSLAVDPKKTSPKEFKILEILIRNFYGNEKNPKFLQYFKLCLMSNNFTDDVNILFNQMFSIIENIDPVSFDEIVDNIIFNGTLTIRNGKPVHRIRAQFIVLEQEGKTQLIESIMDFYLSKINVTAICKFYMNALDIITLIYNENIEDNIQTLYISDNFYDEEELSDEYNIDQYELLAILTDLENENLKGILFYETFLYDIYTLARMFKDYGNESSNQKIVYCGNTHAYYMSLFLTEILKFPMKSYGFVGTMPPDDVSRCINVDIADFIEYI